VNAVLGGMNARHYLSGGLAALPENSNGVPFNMSHIYASGNTAADMYSTWRPRPRGGCSRCGCTT
jgi:Mn-containing catalase